MAKRQMKGYTTLLIIREIQIEITVRFDTGKDGHHQKNLQRINAREGVEKKEASCPAGGNVKKN